MIHYERKPDARCLSFQRQEGPAVRRRDRPALERTAGAWLRNFRSAAKLPGFTVAKHLEELAGDPPTNRGRFKI
ncbi:MAG: hypothetical protein WCJ66_03245 [Verrucomicrobiota bacterium]